MGENMRTILMIAEEILATLTTIDRRLQRIEQAVVEPGNSPEVDALTAEVASATAGLKQSTGGLAAAITQETQP
jgi:hypothetical protein